MANSGRIVRFMPRHCTWYVCVLAGLLGLPLKAQLSDWQIGGRFQFRALESTASPADVLVRRARYWSDGKIHPKFNVRLQYEFHPSPAWWDYYIGFHPTQNLELRAGQSYLPFIADWTVGPWFIDTIDFPAGTSLMPPRERGVFLIGQQGDLTYNLSVVDGNGFAKDENSHKDVYGFIQTPFGSRRARLGVAYYEGRDGPNGLLAIERRAAADLALEPHKRLTLKAAYIRGRDGSLNADAAWFRSLVQVHEKVTLVAEYDTFVQGPVRQKWFDAGVNFDLPLDNSNIKIHYRHFYRPTTFDELKIQLQVFPLYRWR